MNTEKVNRILLMLILGLWFVGPLFADAPYEKYHIVPEKISKAVLRDTIGILTIASGIDKKNAELNTYSRIVRSFTYNKKLKISEIPPVSNFGEFLPFEDYRYPIVTKSGPWIVGPFTYIKKLKISETTPISNFGYQNSQNPPSSFIEDYRYPIVAKSGQYLCIVYNPIKNKRAWINMKEMGANFHSSTIMLDNIETPSSFFIDIFYLAKTEGVKLYKEPSKNAESTSITDKQKYSLLRILEQKGKFIRIGIVNVDFNTYQESVESIGWIRTSDEQGMLTIWIKDEDLC